MEWIKTSDRLPPEGETVWAVNTESKVAVLACLLWNECPDEGEEEGWYWAGSNGTTYIEDGRIVAECDSDGYLFTHWMPLPKPPSGN